MKPSPSGTGEMNIYTNQSEVKSFDFGTTTLPHPDKLPGGYNNEVKLLEMSEIRTIMQIADSNMRAEQPTLPYDNKNAALYAIFGNRSFEAAHNGTVADGAVKAYMIGIRNIREARDSMMQNTGFWNKQLKGLREELNTRQVPASWTMTTEGEVKPTDEQNDPDKKIGMADFIDGLFLKSGEVIKNVPGSAIPTTLGRIGFYGTVWKQDMNTIEAATKASRYARKYGAPEDPTQARSTEGYGRRLAPQKLERIQVEVPEDTDTDDTDTSPTPVSLPTNDRRAVKARGAVALSFLPPEKQQPESNPDDIEDDDDEEDEKTTKPNKR